MRKIVSGIMLTLLLIGMLTLAFNIQPVKSEPRTIIVPDEYPTIQEAINAANPGDTIYVKAGIYSELISIEKNGLRIVGEEKTETIVDGIICIYANNISVGGFTIQGGGAFGVYLEGSSNIVWDNIISTGYYEGICISWYSSNNIIVHNLITPYEGSSLEVYGGIRIDRSNNNIIDENIVSGRPWGITLYEAENNLIIRNTIFNCSRGGMFLMEQDVNNNIYHNNFINNTQQVYIRTPGYVNYWDDGYPSGGNYWSDYTGVDLFSGPYQNETGSDGIGDTPCVIDENNVDHYPLMNPYNITLPIPPVISATVDINPKALNLKSRGKWITTYIELPEGYDVANINVSSIMLNDTILVEPSPTVIGDYDNDTIPDLMVNFNRTIVSEHILSSNIVYGNVTLTLTGQLYNGTIFAGSDIILVSALVGDVNINGYVGIDDIQTATESFGSYPNHPRWNPNANFTPDNYIGIDDICLIAKNFGETYT
jgi:parallel beta-helix repeat protein